MILADNREGTARRADEAAAHAAQDFYGLFKAMKGLPVTIRTLDPPLHEFLPKREDLMVEIATWKRPRRVPKLKDLRKLLEVVEGLHEFNPMLGCADAVWASCIRKSPRCRRGPSSRPRLHCKKKNIEAKPEVMIPLVGGCEGDAQPEGDREPGRRGSFREEGLKVEYLVGTMIELPAPPCRQMRSPRKLSSSASAPTI